MLIKPSLKYKFLKIENYTYTKNIIRGIREKVIIDKSHKGLKRLYEDQLIKKKIFIGIVTTTYKFKDAIIS